MHKRLINLIKYNKVFLLFYHIFGNLFVNILKCFVKVDNKKILFMSFGGRKYDDSPKALYEAMKKDPYFSEYKMVWGFINPDDFKGLELNAVKVDTLKFYILALSSRIWINNSSVERGLELRRKNTIEINTWHGTPLKKMGLDMNTQKGYITNLAKKGTIIYCSQSEYDRDIFVKLFNTKKENILLCDLPRNDCLAKFESNDVYNIKKKIGIPYGKKVILYAPTFREYQRDSLNSCYINPPINSEKWKKELGEEYVVLFRAHYEVINVLGIEDDGFFFNVSAYPSLNELMMVSDMLVSDYSSIYFDYSITEKPMLNFSYDIDVYSKERGLYLDLYEVLPCNINLNEDDLIHEIKTFDTEVYSKRCADFKRNFAPNAGNASEHVIEALKRTI